MKPFILRSFWVLAAGLAFSHPARAEMQEWVTYYSAAAEGGEVHVSSLTVGDAYRTETPGDGTALIAESLGIGTTAPAGPLHVVGVQDNASSVVFVAGAETPALGSPKILVGIGTETPTQAPSPENSLATGNLDVNDVYLRALGAWASQLGSGAGAGGGPAQPLRLFSGTYTGTGNTATQNRSVGFTPKLVFIICYQDGARTWCKYDSMSGAQTYHVIYSSGGWNGFQNEVTIQASGFQVTGLANFTGRTYDYFAVGNPA